MKITIIGPAHPYRGGIAAFNEYLARELQTQGHEVTIETFTLQYPTFLFPGKSQFSNQPSPKDLQIQRSINSIQPLNWKKVGKKIKEDIPELLIVRYWIPFMGAAFGNILKEVKKNKHTKVIALVDNMIPHESRPGDTFLSRFFVKHVDAFLAMSTSVVEDIKSFTQDKPIAITPHPIFNQYGSSISQSEAIEQLNLPKADQYILFFGLVRKYKGLDLLLEALAKLNDQGQSIHLLVAGEFYEEEEKYQQLINNLQLQNQVSITNEFIPDDKVHLYFSAADLLVLPYKSATQSGVTQIAYHFETPMVVTNVGGLPEICPDGKVGFVVDPNPEALAEGIQRFITHENPTDFISQIREEKKKYSWSSFIDALLNLYYN